jgi:hypothetical protein
MDKLGLPGVIAPPSIGSSPLPLRNSSKYRLLLHEFYALEIFLSRLILFSLLEKKFKYRLTLHGFSSTS